MQHTCCNAHDQRAKQRRYKPVDMETKTKSPGHETGQHQHQHVNHEQEQAEREQDHRERKEFQDRLYEHVHYAEHQCHTKQRRVVLTSEPDTGNELRRDPQRERGDQ